MATCRACGRENPEDARFCNACGASLAREPAPPREVRKVVTVLFADVTGSTALGERLDPESTRRVMARWHDSMRTVLERHGGTVEKFIGDAVMAVFGIPTLHEDDALRALRAASEMRDALAVLNEELERDYSVRIETRIGVNTGEVVAGEGETLATGDAVNVAARLEQAADAGEVLVGEQTVRLVRGAVNVESAELPPLKGKTEAVRAYRLLGVRESVPRRLDAPLVGRERELAQLLRAYDHATAERTAYLFTVLGPAGIGKSRLAQELVDGVRADATVLRGRCLPYGDGITYWPLAEMLQEAAHHEVRARLVEQLRGERDADLIAGRLAAAIGAADDTGLTEETFWAVRKLFERLARERPLITVFEDLHWAEPTLLDLVDHVAEWSRDAPILLLCLARPELLESRPGWGGGKLNATSLLLEPLSQEESDELIDRLLGATVPAATRTRITTAAEGNPLFVEQMLAMLAEDGAVAGDVEVPPTIHALLAARLDRLAPGERDVIERAAVEGKRFHLGAITELSPPELQSSLRTHLVSLVRKELIRPETEEDSFRFRHQLIRDAAYEAMPKEVRADLHERFAAWLERAAADRLAEVEEILGYHLEQAYRYRAELGPVGEAAQNLARRAAERLIASGRNALARRDMPAAVSLLSRGIDLAPERLDVVPELGEVLLISGEITRARAVLADGLEAARAAGDERVEALVRLGQLTIISQMATELPMSEVLLEADRLATELDRLGDKGGYAEARSLVGRVRFFQGRASESEADFQAAAESARQAGDQRRLNEVLGWLGGAKRWGRAPASEAIAFYRELLADPRTDALIESETLVWLAALTAMQGRFEEAREFARRAVELFDEFGFAIRKGGLSSDLGYVEMLAGELEAAERVVREGYDLLGAMGETGFRSTIAGALAEILLQLGRESDAERVLDELAGMAADDDFEPQVRLRCVRARLLCRRGELGPAEALAREALSILEPTDYVEQAADAHLALAEVLRASGRADEAARALARAAGLHQQKGNIVMADRVRKLIEELAVPHP